MKIEKRPADYEVVVTLTKDELLDFCAKATTNLISSDKCPISMVLLLGIFSAEVAGMIFNNKGEK